ncbi:unnamed protein product [Brachionus calyciflorus]|uniref:RRM domain-containing protein n=1 Tax=Brachionus calyciflorus TaxID=104777 RepID=A0A814EIK7_9BILA|nr:unnamed protein product [Brachionus calyciflorus]
MDFQSENFDYQQQSQFDTNFQDLSQNGDFTNFANNSQPVQNEPLEAEQFRKVFIGGLNFKTDEETFKAYFSKYGQLVDFVVMKDKETGKSRGFGFVTYGSSAQVDELMKNRPHMLDGRQLETKRATPREDSGKHEVQASVKKLFVGGVRDNITDDDLRNYFSNYGNITDCVVMKDKEKNTARGFGFVTFDDYDPVDKIILEKHHQINGINLKCQKALPKDGSQGQNSRGGGGGGYMGGRGGGNGGGRGGFHMPQNPQFNNNMNNNFGNYNQAPMNNARRGGSGGPMRGGSRFSDRSQGPYGGQNGNRGGRGGGQRGGYRNGNLGQRGGGRGGHNNQQF